jgi:hypothetical protein
MHGADDTRHTEEIEGREGGGRGGRGGRGEDEGIWSQRSPAEMRGGVGVREPGNSIAVGLMQMALPILLRWCRHITRDQQAASVCGEETYSVCATCVQDVCCSAMREIKRRCERNLTSATFGRHPPNPGPIPARTRRLPIKDGAQSRVLSYQHLPTRRPRHQRRGNRYLLALGLVESKPYYRPIIAPRSRIRVIEFHDGWTFATR